MQSTEMSENREKGKKMGRREWYRSVAKREREVSGCMSGMFQFLDFHNILFTPSGNSGRAAQIPSPQIHHYSSSSQFNGVEAPRNSLELDEASAAAKSSTAFAIAAEDYYGIPIGIQVNSAPLLSSLKKQNKKNQGLEEEEKRDSQSQCITPRTTNLVARLMGLDISSEGPSTPKSSFKSLNSSPKISTKNRQPLKKKDTNVRLIEVGTRSLPDTPRASSERSRDADPRLSLQINKENVNRAGYSCEYSSLPPSPTKGYSKKSRKKESCLKEDDENRSPRSHYYAREVVEQVKEMSTHRREKKFLVEEDDRKQFLKSPKPQVLPKHPRPRSATSSVLRVRDQNVEITKPTKMVAGSCERASTEKFTDRIKRKPPLSEAATRSDPTLSRLTLPLPSQSSSPNLVASSSQKHGLSRENMKRSHKNVATLASREDYLPASAFSAAEEQQGFRHARAPKAQDPEFLYVQSILQRSGIANPAQPRRYSPSLAVDPFIFHQLELDPPVLFPYLNHRNPIRHRSNRKLLFHLVQEVLADLLACRPRLNRANDLLDRVWTRIRSFPLADCQVIEDIDALVAGDLAEAKVRRLLSHPLVAAEAERIALEVEEDVMDSVVGEAAASLALCSRL